ncbi:(2,3-dihydroxybenzoyl)adenylate synthase [Streptomyces sp. NBC_00588]|uniref:(2,3-dihydroxybenzoyl)adenylate synthase n=1 Tax=Streptomyces sp. NBC_00588 TaxID=2975784 RepID=UPI002E81B370|nr:(2,3-dihydroxybenzoyl)adenylate synthase [Streptomyces sp. NBC_00588]WUB40278.1 (2,3-dihydroxybenzoyl)adenylate synthase [Streptomyces sp. NBC_00588]
MLDGWVPWPDEVAARYRTEGYWAGRPLDRLLRDQAERAPERIALVDAEGDRWTYAELDARADRTAAGLRRLGIGGGDRVIVQLPNTDAFVVLFFALLRAGAVPVLTLPAHRESEIVHVAEVSGATAYAVPDVHDGFDHRTLARALRKAVPSVEHVLVAGEAAEFTPLADIDAEPVPLPVPDPSDVALLLLSGGTTGKPKLIPRTHDDYTYNVRSSAQTCGFDSSTVYLVVLPTAHNFALACPGLLGTLMAGGTVVLSPTPSPEDAFALIEREKVTVTAVVPPIALLWLDAVEWEEADLSSLRLLQVGGSKLGAEPAARVRPALGCTLQQVFGMAEGLLNYTRLDDPSELVVGTQGRPLSPADEIRVVDEDGHDVAPGATGELLTRGPYTLRGYYRAPGHNARTFTDDGYYRTGDLVRVLPTGHLVVEGRAKDQINRGGDKISAEELENHILAHPGVHDAAVVGMPDATMGERTCAYLVPRGQAPTHRELTTFLAERGVAAYKLPDRVEIVDAFPRTSVGKIDKKALGRTIAERLSAEGAGGD